jgi:hypothetical protein
MGWCDSSVGLAQVTTGLLRQNHARPGPDFLSIIQFVLEIEALKENLKITKIYETA